jgi:hypothetical protein
VFTAWGCAGLLAPAFGSGLTGAGSQRPALLLLLVVSLAPAALAVLVLARPSDGGR